jgi:type II secretory pathway component GspD/PulD (secretin)
MAKHTRSKRSSRSNTYQPLRFRQAALIAFCAATFAVSAAWAQEKAVAPATAAPATAVQAVGPDGKPMAVKAVPPGAKTPAGQPQPGQPQPGQKPGEQKPGEQKAGEPAITTRPTTPEKPANPEELKVRPDGEGKVRFTFTGQPWPAVLEWLATISNMSLDWQELPGDFLNLTTRQSYTVPEARDLINRHLFARGFTILQNDEVLSVVNIKKIDPGVVPRISPEELATRSPYDYVKVSFPLDWMLAETAAEELKPMISPTGKLNPLKSTNRLEVMDVVINLRDVYRVVKEEQSAGDEERLVREFQLQYARASEVVEQLSQLLGVESKNGPKKQLTPQEMQMQQQQAQMRMQMMQQQQQQQGGAKPKPPQEETPVNLVVNTRKNSVLASAPPDKMKIIEQAVKVLDVESQGAENLLANLNRMQVYKLSELDPEALSKMLTDMGLLDPITTVQVDKRNKSIVVYAPMTDHLVIRQLLERLDRTGRTFEVLRLVRLEADQVAGTVEFMINGGAKDDQQQNRRSYYYGFGYYMQGQDEQQSNDKFRVDADIENNQLILWANPVEMEEVRNLLAKLGEPVSRGGGGGNSSTVRVLNVEPGEDTAAALERLRRAWPSLAPNQLLMPDVDSLNGKDKPNGKLPNGRSASRPDKNEEARGGKANTERPSGRSDGPAVVPIDRSPAPVPAIEDDETIDTAAVIAVPAVLHRAAPTTDAQESSDAAAPETAAPADSKDSAKKDSTDKPAPKAASTPSEAPKPAAAQADAQDGANQTGANQTGANQTGANQAGANQAGPDSNVGPIPGRPDRAGGLPPGLAGGRRAIPREPPPVNVTVGANGELIITSPDTGALDLFEEMVRQLAPPRPEYKIFYLKYASAFNVAWNLEDYFQIDKKKDDDNRRPYYYFYDDFGSQNKDETRRLSKRRELTFISDTDSNTILVTGADPSQLKTIEELIALYDRVEPPDSRMARMTTVFTLKYSKAKVVGEAVKDVYRDLLSSNDKALQQQQGGDQNQKNSKRAENVYITNFGGEEGEDPRGTQVRFKGKLSIGIDDLSNTLIVSTEGENLMNNVAKMIESLDQAAKPALNHVHVMNVSGSMDTRDVRRALARAFMEQQRGQPQQQGGQQQPGQNGQQQQQQNGQNPQFQQFGNPQQE